MEQMDMDEFAEGLLINIDSSETELNLKLNPEVEHEFRKKLERAARKKRPRYCNQEIKFYGQDVDDMTGNDCLRSMIKILNSEFLQPGNCFLQRVDGRPLSAYLVIKKNIVELWRPSLPTDQLKAEGLSWVKAFNEVQCERLRKRRDYRGYGSNEVEVYRQGLGARFEEFMHKKLATLPVNYASLFLGLLSDIAKTENQFLSRHRYFRKIPMAATVMLALETQQSGSLHRVFGVDLKPKEHQMDAAQMSDRQRLAALTIVEKALLMGKHSINAETMKMILEKTRFLFSNVEA